MIDAVYEVSKICEGRMVLHAHLEDAVEYQLYNSDGTKDIRSILCSRCAADDIARGFDWRKVDV